MATTTIHVKYQSSGRPCSGARVLLSFTAGLGGVSGEELTDAQGVARVEHASSGSANVIINGTTRGTIRCPGQASFSI